MPVPKPLDDPDIQKRWRDVVGDLQKQQTARFFRLAYSEVVKLGDGVLQIAVTGKNAITDLAKPETRQKIEEAISGAYGQSLRFEAVPADGGEGGAAPEKKTVSIERQGREDPIVKASVEVLQGKIEGVLGRRREGA